MPIQLEIWFATLYCCFSTYRYAFPIKCTEVIFADDKETVLEIRAEYDPLKKTKPKVGSDLNQPSIR